MEEFDRKKGFDLDEVTDVFSTTLRAGKRTYYLDVKSTLRGEHYLSITESRRKSREGEKNFSNIRQTIYVYPEDFEKFAKGLEVTLGKISELKDSTTKKSDEGILVDVKAANPTDLEFESI